METQKGHWHPSAVEQGQAHWTEAAVEASGNLGDSYQVADVFEHPRVGYV